MHTVASAPGNCKQYRERERSHLLKVKQSLVYTKEISIEREKTFNRRHINRFMCVMQPKGSN